MKCRKCGEKASVNMRQHKLALCKEHYLEWVPEQTERFIKKYEMFTKDEKILATFKNDEFAHERLSRRHCLQRMPAVVQRRSAL